VTGKQFYSNFHEFLYRTFGKIELIDFFKTSQILNCGNDDKL